MSGDACRAFISLGSNVGLRYPFLERARLRLANTKGVTLLRASRLYRTRPWGIREQGWFINQCLEITTTLTPFQLLHTANAIERRLGRKRWVRFGPRTLDMDLLIMQDIYLKTPRLQLPHPEMLKRAFVLIPLVEIAPDFKIFGRSVSEYARFCDSRGVIALTPRR